MNSRLRVSTIRRENNCDTNILMNGSQTTSVFLLNGTSKNCNNRVLDIITNY